MLSSFNEQNCTITLHHHCTVTPSDQLRTVSDCLYSKRLKFKQASRNLGVLGFQACTISLRNKLWFLRSCPFSAHWTFFPFFCLLTCSVSVHYLFSVNLNTFSPIQSPSFFLISPNGFQPWISRGSPNFLLMWTKSSFASSSPVLVALRSGIFLNKQIYF